MIHRKLPSWCSASQRWHQQYIEMLQIAAKRRGSWPLRTMEIASAFNSAPAGCRAVDLLKPSGMFVRQNPFEATG
jgi:hypothetical protein